MRAKRGSDFALTMATAGMAVEERYTRPSSPRPPA
jgi:hypothetical protein